MAGSDKSTLEIEVITTGISGNGGAVANLKRLGDAAEKSAGQVGKLTESVGKLLSRQQGAVQASQAQLQAFQSMVQSLTTSVTQLATTLGGVTTNLNGLTNAHNRASVATREHNSHSGTMVTTLKAMTTAALAYVGVNFARSIVADADAWQMMQSRLTVATGSMKNAKIAQEQIYQVSQKIRQPLEAIGTLYTRLSPAMQRIGMDSKATITVVEGVATALKLSGTSAAESASAMLQLSQSFNAGRLNGGEFNSIAEAAPKILDAIALKMKVGREEIKKLGSEGKITGRVMAEAIIEAQEVWGKQFEKMPLTVDDAMTKIKNTWKRSMGELNEEVQFNGGLVTLLETVELIIPVVKDAMATAFKAVGEWITRNKVALGEWWEQIKLLVNDVWNIGKAFFGILGMIGDIGSEFSVWGFAVYSVRLAIAGVQDGLLLVGAGVLKVGSIIAPSLLFPMQLVLHVVQKLGEMIGSLFSGMGAAAEWLGFKDAANVLNGVGNSVKGFAAIVEDVKNKSKEIPKMMNDAAGAAVDYWANGGSAVEKVLAGEKQITLEKQKQKDLGTYEENFNPNPKKPKDDKGDKAAAKEAAKALNEYNREMDSLSNKLQEQIELHDRLMKHGLDYDKLGAGAKAEIALENELGKLKGEKVTKLTQEKQAYLEQQLVLARALKLREAETENLKEGLKLADQAQKERDTLVEKEEKEAQALEDKVATLGMEKAAIKEVELARLERRLSSEDATKLTEKEVEHINKLIDALKRQVSAQKALDDYDVIKKQQKEQVAEWDKQIENIDKIFREGFANMVNGGKSSWSAFTKSLTTTFKTTVVNEIYKTFAKPFVIKMVGSLAGMMGFDGLASAATKELGTMGAASAGSSALSAGSLVSSAATAGAAFTQGLSAGFAQLTAGVSPMSMAASAMDVAANSIATSLGQVAGYLGPIAIAVALLAKGLSYKTVGSGIMGSVVGTNFDGESYQFKKSTLRGSKTVGSELDAKTASGFDKAVTDMGKTFGNLGKVTGAGTDVLNDFNYEFRLALADFDEEGKAKEVARMMADMSDSMAMQFVDKFRTSYDKYDKAVNGYFTNTIDGQKDFGGRGERVATTRVNSKLDPYIDDMLNIFDGFRYALQGVDGSEGKVAEFAQALFTLGASLADNAGFASTFGEALDFDKLWAAGFEAGETVTETFTRLTNIFSSTNSVAAIMGKTSQEAFNAVGLASTSARQAIIDLAGGIDNFTAQANSFAQNFLSEEERLKPVSDTVAAVFAKYNLSGNITREDFAKEVKGAYGTNAQKYQDLMNIQAFVDMLLDYTDSKVSDVVEEVVTDDTALSDAKTALADAYKNEVSALEDAIDKFEDFAKSLKDFKTDLLSGDMSPLTNGQKYAQAQTRYNSLLSRINAGDTAALDEFQTASEALLEISKVYNASGSGYTNDFNKVLAGTDAATLLAEKQVNYAKDSLDALKKQVTGLIDIDAGVKTFNETLLTLVGMMQASGTPLPGGGSNLVNGWYQQYAGRTNQTQEEISWWTNYIAQNGVTTALQSFKDSVMAVNGKLYDGSNLQGLGYVPYDGYLSELHEGERVLTKAENKDYSFDRYRSGNEALVAEIKSLREELKQLREEQAQQTDNIIGSNYDANGRVAQEFVEGTRDALSESNWKEKSKVTLV